MNKRFGLSLKIVNLAIDSNAFCCLTFAVLKWNERIKVFLSRLIEFIKLTIETMLVFLPSLSINFSARMIIDRSLRTRFKIFSSLDFFSLDFSDGEVFSRYSANECDLLIRVVLSKAGSVVKDGAIKLAARSLRFSGFTNFFSKTLHSPLPSTIGRSSRYKSHLPSGLSFPT